MVSGSIIAVDDTSITVQTSDGSTKIVLVRFVGHHQPVHRGQCV